MNCLLYTSNTVSDAVADDLAVDSPLQQISKHPSVVCGCFGQGNYFRFRHLPRSLGRTDFRGGLLQQKQDRFRETHPFHTVSYTHLDVYKRQTLGMA